MLNHHTKKRPQEIADVLTYAEAFIVSLSALTKSMISRNYKSHSSHTQWLTQAAYCFL